MEAAVVLDSRVNSAEAANINTIKPLDDAAVLQSVSRTKLMVKNGLYKPDIVEAALRAIVRKAKKTGYLIFLSTSSCCPVIL